EDLREERARTAFSLMSPPSPFANKCVAPDPTKMMDALMITAVLYVLPFFSCRKGNCHALDAA
ncbi:MAG: hypothetical protein DMG18_05755, partial [Acidobacteria bacterium]